MLNDDASGATRIVSYGTIRIKSPTNINFIMVHQPAEAIRG